MITDRPTLRVRNLELERGVRLARERLIVAEQPSEPVSAPSTATSLEEIAHSWDTTMSRPGGPERARDILTHRFIEASVVDPEIREAAETACALASVDLGIDAPRIHWFAPEGHAERAYRERYGMADWASFRHEGICGLSDKAKHAIGIREDGGAYAGAYRAAHECRHLVQPESRDWDEYWATHEVEAHAYGEKIAGLTVSGRVHRWDGFPYGGETLRGVAETGDLVIARHGTEDRLTVYKNDGSKDSPQWRPCKLCR